MKLLRFITRPGEAARFGTVIGDAAAAFDDLAAAFGAQPLGDVADYLRRLPASAAHARALLDAAVAHPHRLAQSLRPLHELTLVSPVGVPPALFDFALAPQHLRNAARTLMRYEMPRALRGLAQRIADRRYARPMRREDLRFYVGNPQLVSAPGAVCPWPSFTAYLDIEPELAVVTAALPRGADMARIRAGIAGYVIFNDWSARDVQYPEMQTGTLGFMRAKHFENANGLGPFLVTPDELDDPCALAVTVDVGGRWRWQGTTADYAFRAEDALARLLELAPLAPGSVVGLGTVPGCCGLDSDRWLLPQDRIAIQIDGLGTLVQHAGTLRDWPLSRWPARREPLPARAGVGSRSDC